MGLDLESHGSGEEGGSGGDKGDPACLGAPQHGCFLEELLEFQRGARISCGHSGERRVGSGTGQCGQNRASESSLLGSVSRALSSWVRPAYPEQMSCHLQPGSTLPRALASEGHGVIHCMRTYSQTQEFTPILMHPHTHKRLPLPTRRSFSFCSWKASTVSARWWVERLVSTEALCALVSAWPREHEKYKASQGGPDPYILFWVVPSPTISSGAVSPASCSLLLTWSLRKWSGRTMVKGLDRSAS